MTSILSFFDRLFASKELTIFEEAYIDACVEDALGYPNPFITAADPMIRAESQHHIITILDFMRHDHHLNPWMGQEPREQVIDHPRFSLNSIVITYP